MLFIFIFIFLLQRRSYFINLIQTKFPDIKIIKPNVFEDQRGFFFESFNQNLFNKTLNKNIKFVQDNISYSKKNVLRGLHYQTEPFSQGKLVQVLEGDILDVVVDIRKSSPYFGEYLSIFLSSKNNYHLWIPPGFAHGFVVLSEFAKFFYKVTNYYSPSHEKVLKWDDADLGIDWVCKNPILSSKDIINAHSFQELSLL